MIRLAACGAVRRALHFRAATRAAIAAPSGARALTTSKILGSFPVPSESHSVNYHNPPFPGGYVFYMPRQSLIGPGSISGIAPLIKQLDVKKAFIVTDGFLSESGAVKAITDVLDAIGVQAHVFDQVKANPTDVNVADGLRALEATGCDFLISFGGGSCHDCAKAVAMVASNGGRIHDYEGIDKATKTPLPLVSVNTTAGTGSEMTRACVITDTSRHVKMAIISASVTPTIAVDDPTLMVGMPKGLTAATGMDALTHAVEAYMSVLSNPVTDSAALHAIKLIASYLRTAVEDGANLQARDMMSYAQFLGGMAFNSASLGYVHSMAHQLGGFYNLPHGVCNAVLLPVVQEFNASVVPWRFVDVAEAMGVEYGPNPEDAPAAVIAAIRRLSSEIGIPKNLEALGVKPEDFDALAENALKDVCSFTNPRQASHEEIVSLYRQAYDQ